MYEVNDRVDFGQLNRGTSTAICWFPYELAARVGPTGPPVPERRTGTSQNRLTAGFRFEKTLSRGCMLEARRQTGAERRALQDHLPCR